MSVEPKASLFGFSRLDEAQPEVILAQLNALSGSDRSTLRDRFLEARNLRNELVRQCRGQAIHRKTLTEGMAAFRRIREAWTEEMAANAVLRRRIITAFEAASKAEKPSSFVAKIRECDRLWRGIGPAGGEGPALAKEFREVRGAFWTAVRREHVRRQLDRAPPAPQRR